MIHTKKWFCAQNRVAERLSLQFGGLRRRRQICTGMTGADHRRNSRRAPAHPRRNTLRAGNAGASPSARAGAWPAPKPGVSKFCAF